MIAMIFIAEQRKIGLTVCAARSYHGTRCAFDGTASSRCSTDAMPWLTVADSKLMFYSRICPSGTDAATKSFVEVNGSEGRSETKKVLIQDVFDLALRV